MSEYMAYLSLSLPGDVTHQTGIDANAARTCQRLLAACSFHGPSNCHRRSSPTAEVIAPSECSLRGPNNCHRRPSPAAEVIVPTECSLHGPSNCHRRPSPAAEMVAETTQRSVYFVSNGAS